MVAFALGDEVFVALERKGQIATIKYASPDQGGKFWCCPWGTETWNFVTYALTCFHYHDNSYRCVKALSTSGAVLVISWVYAIDLELSLSNLRDIAN